MKKPTPNPLALAGAIAVTAAACGLGGQASAQTMTASMSISMTIATAASMSATAMQWGSITPNPGGTAVMATDGTVSGLVGTNATGTAGALQLTRNVALTATVAAPSSVTMACGTSTVTIGSFVTAAGTTSCTSAAIGNCSFNVGATASFPTGNLATGACTATAVTMTVTYGP